MGYIGQRSRGLAVRRLEELLDDKDREDLKRIAERLRQLSEVFKPEEHLVQTSFNHARRLISVAVDGGDNLIEPEAREIATGFIRVSAFSPDFKELPQPLEFAVKGFRLFAEDDNELSRRISQYIEQLFDHEIFKVFSKETGITTSDLGTYYRKGVPALVSILRDVAEWAYLVYLAYEHKKLNVLLVKDGRLAQVGVEDSFRKKLLGYFNSNDIHIVGVLKTNQLMGEKLAVRLVLKWLESYDVPVAIRVPDELMDYVYTTSRQWDPNREKSLVFGRRHLLRFRKKEFEPLESAIAFDVPEYLAQNKEALSQVVATLWAHRSALYGGSLGPLVEAHERASVGDPVISRLEQELWNLVEREVFRNG
jgi:hypothetical protein